MPIIFLKDEFPFYNLKTNIKGLSTIFFNIALAVVFVVYLKTVDISLSLSTGQVKIISFSHTA